MTVIDAVYEQGVFRPVTPVNLPVRQRVLMRFETTGERVSLVRELLAEVDAVYGSIAARQGAAGISDSTADIAENRRSGHRVG